MKARIWKDRVTGRWCWDLRARGLRATGDRATWAGALAAVLDDMAWVRAHEHVCRVCD